MISRVVCAMVVALGVAGCGGSGGSGGSGGAGGGSGGAGGSAVQPHPQVIEPAAGAGGDVPVASDGSDPVGDPNAHAPPLSEVRHELKLELVAATVNTAGYIDPLQFVTSWGRTDQGIDAGMPVGAPIVAPGPVKILAIEPGWYAGQPLVYFELLNGPDAGKVQYVAEQITAIARPGSILSQGQVIARFAKSGTDIEYGWSTPSGITLAVATTGYEEGQITPAGRLMRAWLNALGANAGKDF
jgi:hypothetical protein